MTDAPVPLAEQPTADQVRQIIKELERPHEAHTLAASLAQCWPLIKAGLLALQEHERAIIALRACDAYFAACARAWTANEGRVFNKEGHTVVEAEGLEELADIAGELTRSALAALDAASTRIKSLKEPTK